MSRRTRSPLLLVLLATVSFVPRAAAAETSGGMSREQRGRIVEELFEAEPTASQVHDVAMRYYELNPSEIARIRSLLRSKSAVPYFDVSQRYQNTHSDREMRVSSNFGVQTHETDDSFASQRVLTGGILAWNLPAAVMSDSEFQSYQLALIQSGIISTVNSWFYSRRMLLMELLIDPPRDPRAYTSLRLRVDGFTALLDIYTGGWYSRQLPEIPEALRSGSSGSGARP